MKQIYLFLLSLVAFAASSQNWAPINATERFCYSNDNDLEIINNVLWVDSIKQMDDHMIYYFNKIVAFCDTCSNPNYMMLNQPQFLLEYAKVFENGIWEFESSAEQFKILTNAQLNDEWVFDEVNGLSAQVSSLQQMEVLGEMDSIKIITLSSQESIIMTKNHGILQWFSPWNSQLIGIEGRDLGVIVPTFRNMYQNWSAGDVICYSYTNSLYDEMVNTDSHMYKFTVIGVEKNADSIVISTSFLHRYTYNNYGPIFNQGEQDLVFYPDAATEAYPNEIFYDPKAFPNNLPGGEDTLIMQLTHHEWGGVKKQSRFVPAVYFFDSTSIFIKADNPALLAPLEEENYYSLNWYNSPEYSANFTFYESLLFGFEWDYEYELVGLIDNGDTLGTIFPDEILMGTRELTAQTDWFIYPNPANDFIQIKGLLPNQEIQITIIDINGNVLLSKITNAAEPIDLSLLSSGIYQLLIEREQTTETKKLIKL